MIERKIYRIEFIIPSIIVYTLLFMLPVAVGLILSFTTWNAMGEIGKEYISFNGIKNYIEIFTKSKYDMWPVLGRTILFGTVTTIGKNLFGFILALLCYKTFKTCSIIRGLFFLPSMIAPVAIGMLFSSFFVTEGVLNNILINLGYPNLTHSWLQDDWKVAFSITMGVDIWRQAGFNMVIYIAGLSLIDNNYFEAASIDGAGYWKQLIYIIIPNMISSLSINLILNLSVGLKMFDIVQVMTAGGPIGKTELLATKMYKLYGEKDYGISCAFGMVMFIVTSVFGFISMKLTEQKEDII